MKGKVEVFVIAADGSEKLVLSEPNLIVDGAGQSIVDMFTCPSTVLTVAPQVADASNWRWGAISFGPAASSFQENAYFFPQGGEYISPSSPCEKIVNVSSFINQISQDHILRVLWASGTIGAENGATASSYIPPYRLPSYPDPLDTKLEDASTAYSIVSGDGTQSFGQFENRIMFASGDASSYFQGVYPVSGDPGVDDEPPYVVGQTSAMLVSSYEGDFSVDPLARNVIVSSPQANKYATIENVQIGSSYNINAAMDYRGFIETQYGLNRAVGHGEAAISGVVISNDAVDLCLDPRVVMETTIYASDLWAMNLYGGLHQIGLWSLDCEKSLETSTVPLFTTHTGGYIDSNGVTPREFRLFAKKTFTENLCVVKDDNSTSDTLPGFIFSAGHGALAAHSNMLLKIRWIIDFRSKHD